MDLEGTNAIVTGGSSGIGKATARLLAREGANTFIIARDQRRLEQALLEIETERSSPDQCFGAQSADVTDYEAIDAAIAAIAKANGPPGILVNSAGSARPGHFGELPLSEFSGQMEINYLGTIHSIRAVLPHMMARGGGHIVNIASVAGVLGVFGYTAYGASKFAVMGLSEALRIELKPHNIGVSVVIPNDTETPQLRAERTVQPLETKITEGLLTPKHLNRPSEVMAYWLVRLMNGGGKLLDPAQVASAVLKGIRHGRYLIVPDPLFRVAYHLRGFVIPLANWAFDQLVPVARRQREAEQLMNHLR